MADLQKVQQTLLMNRHLIVAGYGEKRQPGLWSRVLEYFVAPREEVRTIRELRSFMDSLSHLSPPAIREDPGDPGGGETAVLFGKLCFTENAGSEKPRCLTVWVYPNERLAAHACRQSA